MTENGSTPTPAQLMQFLDQAASELDSLGKKLEAANLSLGDCEAVWEEEKDIALVAILEEYADKKLPGEDVRRTLIRQRIGFQPYRNLIKAKRLVDSIEGRVRRYEKAVNARQSVLNGLQAELSLESRRGP